MPADQSAVSVRPGASPVGRQAGLVRRVDLHIGVEKTGTTTLQRALHASRDVLAEHGVCYPESLGIANHMALAIIGRPDDAVDDLRRRRQLDTPEAVRAFRVERADALRAEVLAAGCDRLVLSSEHCSSRLLQLEDVARLVGWIEATVGGELHVHVYLRRQDLMVESRFSTAVRMGAAAELEVPEPRAMRNLYDFDLLLDRWASVVGEERVHPRRFERSRLEGGDVIHDACAVLQLPVVVAVGDDASNTALDAATQQFSILMNRHVPRFVDGAHNPLHAHLVRGLDSVEAVGPSLRLQPAERDRLLSSVAASNARVARRWFDEDNLFEETPATTGDVGTALDVERAVDIAGHVLNETFAELAETRRDSEKRIAAKAQAEVSAAREAAAEEIRELRTEVDRVRGALGSTRANLEAARARIAKLEHDRDVLWDMRSHRLGRALTRPFRLEKPD